MIGFLNSFESYEERDECICCITSDIVGKQCKTKYEFSFESLRNVISMKYKHLELTIEITAKDHTYDVDDFIQRVLMPGCLFLSNYKDEKGIC